MPATAETIQQLGSMKAYGNNNIGYIRVSSNSRGSINRANSNSRLASNFANQKASKMLYCIYNKNQVRMKN
jgi:hypothetical protein